MQIRLSADTMRPELRRIMAEVGRPAALYGAGAKAVQVGISRHLRALQARGNRMGWPDKGFFFGSPTAVERRVGIVRVTDQGAEVAIADPRFLHRVQGGRVTAKRVKMLAIPLTAEAYGASGQGSLKEAMPGLKVVVTKKGAWLAREEEERVKGKSVKVKGGKRTGLKRLRLRFLFRLVKSVTHRAHREELPDRGQLESAAAAAMVTAGRRLLKAEG